MELDLSIFKAYDIRGVVGNTLNAEVAYAVGRAMGALIRQKGQHEAVLGRDGRLSGPELSKAVAEGLRDSGIDVVDVGMVPTPMVYFATFFFGHGSCVQVTGSHNPPRYNGFKLMAAGQTLYGETIKGLYDWICTHKPKSSDGVVAQKGQYREFDIWPEYLKKIVDHIRLERPVSLAIDCGNGVAGAYAEKLYQALGCTVKPIFCEVNGHFPNHHPDPADPKNLQDLIQIVKTSDAEFGIAFDGDGDRLGVVTKTGEIIYPDRQLILFAQDVLSRCPGEQIIFDVKCSRNVERVIRQAGGYPLMWRTGHSLIKAKLRETGAPLAGEMSGHIFFKERWYGFDDGLYAGVRLLEILSRHHNVSSVLENLPNSLSTPELQIKTRDGKNFEVVQNLLDQSATFFPGASKVISIDGVRAEYSDGFGLARASNTTSVIVLRFEADTPEALIRIQNEFKKAISSLLPAAMLPF